MIAEELQINVTDMQWIVHAENISLCIMCLLSTRLYNRFNIQLIFTIGCYIIAVSNILLGFFSHILAGFITLRLISSSGYGVVLPVLSPFCNNYSIRERLATSLVVCDILTPIAYIFGTFITGMLMKVMDY